MLKPTNPKVDIVDDAEGAPDRADSATSKYRELLDEQKHEHRDRFGNFALGISQTWVGFLIVLTIAQMMFKKIGLSLTPAEFIAVFTTTTASVFGFGLIWGLGLYPGARKK